MKYLPDRFHVHIGVHIKRVENLGRICVFEDLDFIVGAWQRPAQRPAHGIVEVAHEYGEETFGFGGVRGAVDDRSPR